MIDKIINWFKVYSRKEEEATERDGFLSYAGEFHALTIGIGLGIYSGFYKEPGVMAAVVGMSFGLGVAGSAQRRLRKALEKAGSPKELSSVIGEMRREPWYSVGGALIGFVMTAVATHSVGYIKQIGGI